MASQYNNVTMVTVTNRARWYNDYNPPLISHSTVASRKAIDAALGRLNKKQTKVDTGSQIEQQRQQELQHGMYEGSTRATTRYVRGVNKSYNTVCTRGQQELQHGMYEGSTRATTRYVRGVNKSYNTVCTEGGVNKSYNTVCTEGGVNKSYNTVCTRGQQELQHGMYEGSTRATTRYV